MTAQTRREIDNEVKSLLSGSGSNNRREAGELKALRALKLGDPEEAKKSKYCIPLKVWKMMNPKYRTAMRSVEEVKIGIVKDNTVNMGRPAGWKISQQHKKIRAKFLQITQTEVNKNYTSFMKNVDEFILDCGR